MRKILFALALCGTIAPTGRGADVKVAERGEAIAVDVKQFKYLVDPMYQSAFGYDGPHAKAFWYTNGVGEVPVAIPASGDYEIRIKASGDSALNQRAMFKLGFAGELIGKETTLTTDEVAVYTFKVASKAGEQKLTIEFTNDDHKEGEYDRNLYIHEVTLQRVR